MIQTDFLLSVIVPVYNEKGNINPLIDRLLPVVKSYKYEIVFIDDGSSDKSSEEIKKFARKNPYIKLVSFYRNFGHQMALSCGYRESKGDCVISMDSDLQDPPEIIKQMVEQWQMGSMVVYAKRKTRNVDKMFKRASASFFYKLINFLSDVPIPKDVGDFRLLDRKVVNYLNSLPEQSRFLRGLVSWGGFPSTFVSFDREKRNAGSTHYTFGKMMNFALDGITSFSLKPLRLAMIFGFIAALVGFLGMVYAILEKFYFPQNLVTGWAAIFVGIMFLGGVQLLTIGIIGEYIGKIFIQVRNRPNYTIKEKFNFK
ncbi:MAG: glycosyltransferase family 2 protein [bacterium]